jgi:hypothetical protein
MSRCSSRGSPSEFGDRYASLNPESCWTWLTGYAAQWQALVPALCYLRVLLFAGVRVDRCLNIWTLNPPLRKVNMGYKNILEGFEGGFLVLISGNKFVRSTIILYATWRFPSYWVSYHFVQPETSTWTNKYQTKKKSFNRQLLKCLSNFWTLRSCHAECRYNDRFYLVRSLPNCKVLTVWLVAKTELPLPRNVQ